MTRRMAGSRRSIHVAAPLVFPTIAFSPLLCLAHPERPVQPHGYDGDDNGNAQPSEVVERRRDATQHRVAEERQHQPGEQGTGGLHPTSQDTSGIRIRHVPVEPISRRAAKRSPVMQANSHTAPAQ
jgi:hypothetical protein